MWYIISLKTFCIVLQLLQSLPLRHCYTTTTTTTSTSGPNARVPRKTAQNALMQFVFFFLNLNFGDIPCVLYYILRLGLDTNKKYNLRQKITLGT